MTASGVLPVDGGSVGFGGMNDRFFLRGVLEFLDSPEGKAIGRLLPGQSECAVANASGIPNLYLTFPGGTVNSVDWFKFE